MNGDIPHSEQGPPSLPRRIVIHRGHDGYGFNLHGEKGIHGQFISAIDDGSPAQKNDLRVGDRVIAVNDEDVEDYPHSKVVERIRAGGNQVILLVVDEQCDNYYKKLGVKIPQDRYETPSTQDVTQKTDVHDGDVVVHGQNDTNNEKKEGEQENVQEPAKQGDSHNAPDNHESHEDVASTKDKSEEKVDKTESLTSPRVDESSKLDMAAARPKPKRLDVKRATQDWKQKYDDFNKL
ncbi:Na(+)/H(+) exchange regulatory cofactor NHE-RF1-like [Xenia sp. Carnegie-2017]|uniref:Na(+)/H(+) exchange regulatory cofactor NHE-RF1-like n=1 Tax=Xenia sp. Carnegie-2017 TaxID=2897299 RepID=UPI001F033C6F|nr:Na(+)/H(+) exchange regulatory cofactor NHE-RF1-like [Xenia sp. Carnegie-2017]